MYSILSTRSTLVENSDAQEVCNKGAIQVVIVTRHATKRAHQRFGIPKRSVSRLASNVIKQGTPLFDLKKQRPWMLNIHVPNSSSRHVLVYRQFCCIFEVSEASATLITILNTQK
jgi:hypothetical protein